jgi:hypothetical protein
MFWTAFISLERHFSGEHERVRVHPWVVSTSLVSYGG